MSKGNKTTIRCAIYTRKSSEEGLEQDFNSLDAQREACAAYVMSQASEGWTLLPEHYDDGGISGGTLDRPALQRLLADVGNGLIDIIVVYKVDRLTRSLLDFAKLVESFDRSEVSFVSVTQSFNTTTSMGRLTLNMLLSFAQFEREVTAERIRDKLAASKAKGMWMGGIPPLGYAPEGRSLAIVEEHASLIRDIFARYLDLGNVRLLADALQREGRCVPVRTLATGKQIGGGTFGRGQIYKILSNPVYRGMISHKGKIHDGPHRAIIDDQTWTAVQQRLADNGHQRRTRNERSASLLVGLLFDHEGQPLKPVHTSKPLPGRPLSAAKRYRYYALPSPPRPHGSNQPPPLRIAASEIEPLVRKELKRLFDKPLTLIERAGIRAEASILPLIESRARELGAALDRGGRKIVRSALERITIHRDHVILTIDAAAIARLLQLPESCDHGGRFEHCVEVAIRRTGMAVRLVEANGQLANTGTPDLTLVRLIHRSRRWWNQLSAGDLDIASLARQEGFSSSYVSRLIRLAFLSPEVIEAVLAGRAPASLNREALRSTSALAADWDIQRQELLGGRAQLQ